MSRTKQYTKVPTHLTHRPIYVTEGYSAIDGTHKQNTDVIGISIGEAQWEQDEFEPSVKVWRDVKNDETGFYRLSRQSEETTITRALDMAMMVIKVLDKNLNGSSIEGIHSVHGSVRIMKAENSTEIDRQLRQWINDNKDDILAHVDILEHALSEFRRHER